MKAVEKVGCDRCGVPVVYKQADYCNHCERTYCDKCMVLSCCGHQPVVSGLRALAVSVAELEDLERQWGKP